MYELIKFIGELLVDTVSAIVSANGDAQKEEDALIDAEFRIARERARRKFAQK